MIKHISIAGESALGNILKGAHISIMRAFSKLRRDTEYDKVRLTVVAIVSGTFETNREAHTH